MKGGHIVAGVPRLVVVVPAFNAARHLAGVVERILRAGPPGLDRIVVVDDGSRDDTVRVARALALTHPVLQLIERPRNGGYGAAMKDGLRAARARDADCAASVHADGQYSPEVLADLLETRARRGLDLLQGSRIAGGQALAGRMPLYKYAGNWAIGKLERRVFALPLTDFHSGYLVYGRRALHGIPFDRLSDGFDFDLEAIAAACARGLAVGEAPIPTHYGDEISHLRPLHYTWRVLQVMWRYKRGAYAA
ncbi:MAG TPA: glycosyltransferase family 2 protein [Polyangia bacterium]|nr:glycosyltransferase family 2 protein [Polyangia bacterium]